MSLPGADYVDDDVAMLAFSDSADSDALDGSDHDDLDAMSDDDGDESTPNPARDDDPMAMIFDGTDSSATPTSTSKKSKQPHVKITDLLQMDSVFDLQVDSLLAEVAVAVPPAARDLLVRIKTALEASKPLGPFTHVQAQTHLRKARIAWPWTVDLGKDVQYAFAYAAPARIDVVGSFLVGGEKKGALIKRRDGYNLDLAVQMPSNLFQPKDHTNYRYFYKRAFYLAHVASLVAPILKGKESLSFAYDHHDVRKPILNAAFPAGKKTTARIVIRPTIAADLFRADKLSATRNNVRPADDSPIAGEFPATPAYNAAVLADMHVLTHLHTLHTAAVKAPALHDAMRLLKVWCEQRNLNAWAFPLVYAAAALVHQGQVGRDLRASHIFRMVVFYLANHDWTTPLVLGAPIATVSADEFTGVDVAVVDQHGVNLASWATRTDAVLLKMELQHACRLAERGDFPSLFLTPAIHASSKFDHLVSLPVPSTPPAFYNPRVRLDFPHAMHFLTRAVPRLLTRALTDRVHVATALPTPTSTWPITDHPHAPVPDTITVGLIYHADNYARSVDVGPSPADDESGARDFRRVWGTKAELRRFPDGTIRESVAWTKPGHSVVGEVLDYVVQRHMQVVPSHWTVRPAVKMLKAVVKASAGTHSAEMPIDAAFRKLETILFGLDDAPLPVAAVLPVAPELTRTAIAAHRHPALFVLELEASGKWPAEPEALYHMMTLFLVRYAQLLAPHGVQARVVTSPLSLDLTCAGHQFTMFLKPRGGAALVADIKHAQDVHQLALAHNGFADSVRLVKLFVARHMLGYHMHDQAVEVLVAHVFTVLERVHANVPVSPVLALVRALELVIRHDWKVPLVVKTRQAAAKLDDEDEDKEAKDTVVVAPPADGTVVIASEHKRHVIETVAMRRLRQVAKAALAYLQSSTTLPPTDLRPVLSTTAHDHDILITLKREIVGEYVVPGRARPAHQGFDPVDMYLRDVTKHVGTLARVFFNDVDGDTVGVVLDPMQLVPRRWAVGHASVVNPRVLPPVEDEDEMDVDGAASGKGKRQVMVQVNVEAVAAELARLGEGLVARVTVQREEVLHVASA
ncbi:hypothetical protein AMAG_15898 [Allomyces macrogynus ATCC 38327]|uniref:U3 small nucleolar RNA-associated protein 22 n=1 Tax=Allomyces macrogynus (strain ATCC 38327) TaxID=578462 RepID=A0A0L0T9K6_ALLM3|nr:hypothetical protein AMAG_15898 [Allomyces macrogynus ATCC 38327]|eukprot:KNE71244.1 hypothetical protein AMAG_15898 [Allomyces macrogynus ATCC 38327]